MILILQVEKLRTRKSAVTCQGQIWTQVNSGQAHVLSTGWPFTPSFSYLLFTLILWFKNTDSAVGERAVESKSLTAPGMTPWMILASVTPLSKPGLPTYKMIGLDFIGDVKWVLFCMPALTGWWLPWDVPYGGGLWSWEGVPCGSVRSSLSVDYGNRWSPSSFESLWVCNSFPNIPLFPLWFFF